MSLVVNANANGGAYQLANEFLDMPGYPDFKQLLLKPIFPMEGVSGLEVQAGDNVPSRYEALSVNGTRINFRGSDIIMPICFQGNGAGGGYGNQSKIRSVSGALTGIYRVGMKQQLKGGEIVGKLIRGAVHYASSSTASTSRNATIRVGLLHTDGTISYCGNTINTPTHTSSAGGGRVHLYSQSNSGLVASAGDYVIADVGIDSTSQNHEIGFGMDGGPALIETATDNNGMPFPIEISIE